MCKSAKAHDSNRRTVQRGETDDPGKKNRRVAKDVKEPARLCCAAALLNRAHIALRFQGLEEEGPFS